MPDPVQTETCSVWKGDERAGRLVRTAQGSVFEYDDAYRARVRPDDGGIAFRLPLVRPRVETAGVNLHPFFAGLLPEGIRLDALVGRVKTSRDDLFSLLLAAGGECIGDVSVVPEGEEPGDAPSLVDASRPEDADFDAILRSSLEPDSDAPRDASFPGVQEKVSASMISLPVRSRRAAHILKLNPPDRPLLIENEEFFLRMAAACGLEAAKARLVRDRNGRSGLLVERFDRVFVRGRRRPEKVHQEDACQFLDRYPADKYRIPAREIVEAIGELATAPAVETLRFLELYAFSYLIGNGDLHAKNVSLWRSPATGLVELTPAYDLLTTLAYRGLDRRMAIRLDGKDDNFRRPDFVAFGERHGVRAAATEAMLDALLKKCAPWIGRLGEIGWTDADLKRVDREMTSRRESLQR